MKHTKNFFIILFIIGFLISAKGQEAVKDFDGNVYKTFKAGNQLWMAENLKVTHYRNGNPIPNVKDPKEWIKLTAGAYCDVNNNPEMTKVLGRLYNWYSVSDPRNVCPAGWHVPTDADWNTLAILLFGDKGNGGVLPGSIEINKGLFKLLPEPFRGYDGEYSHIGYGGGGWWSSTTSTTETAFYHNVSYNTISKQRLEGLKYYGYNVRCIKD
jgi:uncharacterized protein (TIGR02145 family)